MWKIIQITDKHSGHFVAEYSVKPGDPNTLSEEDWYNEAWNNALAEGIVSKDNRSDYRFIVSEEMPSH